MVAVGLLLRKCLGCLGAFSFYIGLICPLVGRFSCGIWSAHRLGTAAWPSPLLLAISFPASSVDFSFGVNAG